MDAWQSLDTGQEVRFVLSVWRQGVNRVNVPFGGREAAGRGSLLEVDGGVGPDSVAGPHAGELRGELVELSAALSARAAVVHEGRLLAVKRLRNCLQLKCLKRAQKGSTFVSGACLLA